MDKPGCLRRPRGFVVRGNFDTTPRFAKYGENQGYLTIGIPIGTMTFGGHAMLISRSLLELFANTHDDIT